MQPICPTNGVPSCTHDITSLFGGEDIQGTWTLHLIDDGFIMHEVFDDVDVYSWDLEFTRQTVGMSASPICDVTQFESMVIQYMLDTFVIGVR